MTRTLTVLVVIFCVVCRPCFAGNVKTTNIKGHDIALVTGVVDSNMLREFRKWIATARNPSSVVLQSPGGYLFDGIDIALIINFNNLITIVPENSICASVCVVMLASGSQKIVHRSSKIGVHAAYDADQNYSVDGTSHLVHLLNNVGIPKDIVDLMITTLPADITWLTLVQLTRMGIKIEG